VFIKWEENNEWRISFGLDTFYPFGHQSKGKWVFRIHVASFSKGIYSFYRQPMDSFSSNFTTKNAISVGIGMARI